MCFDMCFALFETETSSETETISDHVVAQQNLQLADNHLNNGMIKEARMYHREGLRFLNSAIEDIKIYFCF